MNFDDVNRVTALMAVLDTAAVHGTDVLCGTVEPNVPVVQAKRDLIGAARVGDDRLMPSLHDLT